MTRAVLDACVLYSAALRDLFMRLTVQFAFQPVWTERIQEEWISNVLLNRPDLSRAHLERTRDLMERYGRDWQAAGYEQYVDALTLPDAHDRHVLAAALASNAGIIVTYNLADFPSSVLAPRGVEAQHPDSFLCGLFDEDPGAFVAAVRDLLSGLKNPPASLPEELDVLRKLGLPRAVERISSRASEIVNQI